MGLPLGPQGTGIWSLRPLQVGPAEILGFRPVSDAEPTLGQTDQVGILTPWTSSVTLGKLPHL